jgi:hypothetical protein
VSFWALAAIAASIKTDVSNFLVIVILIYYEPSEKK